MSPPHRVEFLDNDHVLELVATVLGGASRTNVAAMQEFFAPDEMDVASVFAMVPDCGLLSVGELPPAYGVQRRPSSATEVLVMRRGRITQELIEALPRLRLIVRLGARQPVVDPDAALARGISIVCVPRRSLEWTAEHAILLMMALGKKLIVGDRIVRRGDGSSGKPAAASSAQERYNWPGLTGLWGLSGRVLAVVGMGEVGTLVASRAEAMGMRVIPCGATADRDKVLGEAEVVSLHVPGTPANHGLVDAGFLNAMRRGAVLVNTSRGSLLDERAVHAALTSGRLAGLGIDVHATEPRPPGDPLSSLDSVVLTPHVAAGSRAGVLHEIAAIAEQIRSYAEEPW